MFVWSLNIRAEYGVRSFAINSTHNCNQNQLLSASLAIQTFAIKLIYYQLSGDQIHLISSLIYYLASTAIDTFAINPKMQSIILLSIIICIKFSTSSQSLFLPIFFLLKICKRNGKISQHLEFFILWQTLRGHGTGSFCCLKILKDINKYLYFHYKDKTYNTQATYRCQIYRNGCKACSCSTKGIQWTGFDGNLFRK